MINISYAFLVHNEAADFKSNVSFIKEYLENNDEIVVVADNPTPDVLKVLEYYKNMLGDKFRVFNRNLNKDFSAQKNYLNTKCKCDYIFNIDADEIPSTNLINNLKELITINIDADVIVVPRINVVYGITQKHLDMWGWKLTPFKLYKFISANSFNVSSDEFKLLNVNDLVISISPCDEETYMVTYYDPIIQFPDYQMRIYKNHTNIKWKKPVHEILTGFKTIAKIPDDIDTDLFLYHIKNITRQEQQNNLYKNI